MFLSKIKENTRFFHLKVVFSTADKNSRILHRLVIVMIGYESKV